MVTMNTIRWSTPIKDIPTSDNVKIAIEIGVNLHIGTNENRAEDCRKFIYFLGAARLEELLE